VLCYCGCGRSPPGLTLGLFGFPLVQHNRKDSEMRDSLNSGDEDSRTHVWLSPETHRDNRASLVTSLHLVVASMQHSESRSLCRYWCSPKEVRTLKALFVSFETRTTTPFPDELVVGAACCWNTSRKKHKPHQNRPRPSAWGWCLPCSIRRRPQRCS